MAFDRNKMKQRLQTRTKEIYDQGSGSQFKTILIPHLPEGIGVLKLKAGNHTVDVIPYLAGDKDPNCQLGDPTYVLAIWVHFNVGPQNDSYICMAKNYNKPCAVCDFIREGMKRGLPKSELDKLKVKERALYYVICYDNTEEERKGLQIWNAPHFKMQRYLNELSKVPERQGVKVGGHISFTDPDEGKTVCFKIVGEKESTDYIAHRFLDRDYVIPDNILELASNNPIDKLIHIPTFEEVSASIGLESLLKKNSVDNVGDQKELPLPSETPSRVRPEPSPDNTSGASEEVADEAESSPAAAEGTCPGGGVFGEDIENLTHCASCEVYGPCKAEMDQKHEERLAQRRLNRKK